MRLINESELTIILSSIKPIQVKYNFPTIHTKTKYPSGSCSDDILKQNLTQIKDIALANLDENDSSKIKSMKFEFIHDKGFCCFVKYENTELYVSSIPTIKAFSVKDSLNAWLWFFFENLKGVINRHKNIQN